MHKRAGLDFDGRVAVVTGSASGIGRAVAEGFAHYGATVCLVDRNESLLSETAGKLRDTFPEVTVEAYAVDITDDEHVDSALSAISAAHGYLHHLVNSAVNFVAAGADATRQDWETAFGVNVISASMLTAKFADRAGDAATVVNVSSISAHVAQPNRWTYNATKAAILALTRGQALDLSARGIRVNAVSPGWIWTPEVEKAAGGDRERWEPVWGRYHILQRLGEPAEVANSALFLSSELASFITGTELLVDGGYRAIGSEGLGDTAKFAARAGKE
jgi:NAD(P)-dependent dehydrogenase (short-subunit alcohol dehydrogenase family)